eukprot:TRINITY_DN461_c0_g2_i2.p1 TRINITY_DN461_c0_g2~~TRINITY_DN461_c0_g2_i2.p1  ORF type:complete len:176 (+),score=35.33 TRINITY_DN461_c0_g2_i2:76-528(+)
MAPLTLRRPIVTGPVMGPIVVKVNLKLKGAHLERDFFNKLADVHVLARTKSGYLSSVLMQSHENPLKYRLHIYFNNAADWLKWKDHAARKAVYDTVGGLLSEPYSDEMFRVVQRHLPVNLEDTRNLTVIHHLHSKYNVDEEDEGIGGVSV